MQNRRLEPMGLATPGESSELTGRGLGVADSESAGRDCGRVWDQTDQLLGSKSEPVANTSQERIGQVAQIRESQNFQGSL